MPKPLQAAVERQRVFVPAGGLVASAEPLECVTVLGSCVSVCLWDPVRRIGGLNHYLLPQGAERMPGAFRIAESAIAALIERLGALGTEVSRLKAKVLGGASMTATTLATDIGQRNAAKALATLEAAGIEIAACDVGGSRGRKLLFHNDTGEAWVRLL